MILISVALNSSTSQVTQLFCFQQIFEKSTAKVCLSSGAIPLEEY